MECKDKMNFLYPKCLGALLRGLVEVFIQEIGWVKCLLLLDNTAEVCKKSGEKEEEKNVGSVIQGNLVSLQATWE